VSSTALEKGVEERAWSAEVSLEVLAAASTIT
jgi:hypothetical protein